MVYKEVIKAFLKNYKFLPRVSLSLFSIFISGKSCYTFPLRAQIENSTVCNLSCQMCPLTGMKRKRGFMTFEQFRKIYDVLHPPFLNLTGYGESFLNKDIFKMVSYAKRHGSFVKFDSNGTLLTSAAIDQVFKSKLDLISFSLDGVTKKTYEKIRVGSNFEKVVAGITSLVDERNKRKSPLQVHLAMVVQIDNVNELMDFIEFGEKIGVDKVNPTPVVEYDLPSNKKFLLDKYKKELSEVVEEYLLNKDKDKVAVDIDPIVGFIKEARKAKVCMIPWYSTYISWEGDVYPCCYYYDGQIKFGNIYQDSFERIWNNSHYQKFRETLRDKRNNLPICKACSLDEKFLVSKMRLAKNIPLLGSLSKMPI